MYFYTLVQAYYAKNLGDDMFVQELVRRYPRERFLLLQPCKRLGNLVYEKNVRALQYPLLFFYIALVKIIRRKDSVINAVCKRTKAVVRIGGSIFIEKKNWKETITKTLNKNTYILGANFGPYTSEEYLRYAVQQIKLTKDCCFRDRYSYDLLSKELSNVRYAPDILFSYPYLPKEKGGNSIGISVIDFTKRDSLRSEKNNYINGIIEICRYFIEKKRNIVLYGFCQTEGDENAIDEIIEILGPTSRIKKCIYSGDIERYLQEINECEKIYATRFHAMIIGWIMKKDVVPIIYSNKQINVIKDLDFNGVQWDILHNQAFPLGLFDTNNGRLSENTIHMLQIEAVEHFKKLDEFYSKNRAV